MKLWEDKIRRVVPYTPGEQPKRPVIKLNTNECPYPPSPAVQEALDSLDTSDLRLYPDTEATPLADALAEYYGVDPDQIFIGVGSDDVLAMAFMTFFQGEKPILFPDITYSFYDVWAQLFRIPYETVPLDEEFRMTREGYYRENGGVIFPNPNAPTAIAQDLDGIRDILDHNQDVIVIVDEAYVDFSSKPSALALLEEYENLLVVQTFSKSRAMAGMRIGYAFGSPELIRAMKDVKYSFNSYTMNLPAQTAGAAAVRDDAYFQDTVARVIHTREKTAAALKELGFVFPPSDANFLFASHRQKPAREIYEELKKRDIFVRYFDKPRISNYLRITIGTDEQMETLLRQLKQILGEFIAKDTLPSGERPLSS